MIKCSGINIMRDARLKTYYKTLRRNIKEGLSNGETTLVLDTMFKNYKHIISIIFSTRSVKISRSFVVI